MNSSAVLPKAGSVLWAEEMDTLAPRPAAQGPRPTKGSGRRGPVHQETCSVGAACGGDFFHIRDHAVIGGEVMHTVRMDSCSESAAETCSAVGLSRYTGVRSSSAMAL